MQKTEATRQHTPPLEGCPSCGGTGWTQSTRHRTPSMIFGRPHKRRCWCCYGTVKSPGVTRGLYWKNENPPGKMNAAAVKYLQTQKPLSQPEVRLLKWYICQWVLGVLDRARKMDLSETGLHDIETSLLEWKEVLAGATRRESLDSVIGWLQKRDVIPF